MQCKDFDFIFLGAGCASLSVVMRMIESGQFTHRKILILEKAPKVNNDRTWCFWEEEAGFFEDIVYHQWTELFVSTGAEETIPLEMGHYRYKMIRGIDFYDACFATIRRQKNIQITYASVSFVYTGGDISGILVDDQPMDRGAHSIVFNSIVPRPKKHPGKFYLIQHFKGWWLESKHPIFTASQATLMDFRLPQIEGTTFGYVLPLSATKALIEYTLFSASRLPPSAYDQALRQYIEGYLGLKDYRVTEEEFGVIPMSNDHPAFFKNGLYFIGTAGGQTKASTGYTFRFIQKQADQIVSDLIRHRRPSLAGGPAKRFRFYDSTLLHILSKRQMEGKIIFSILFKKNDAGRIFRFLDNESTFTEELKLINSLPKKVFIRAGLLEFFKMMVKI